MKEPKFKVGDKVQSINDQEVGTILSFVFNSESGFTYTVDSKTMDPVTKEIFDAVRHLPEDELKLVTQTNEDTPKEEAKVAEGKKDETTTK